MKNDSNPCNKCAIVFFSKGLLVLGQLPASTIGLGRNDNELAHRTGSLGRPPHDVLLPPPRVQAPTNPFNKGIQSFKRGIKRVVGKVNYFIKC